MSVAFRCNPPAVSWRACVLSPLLVSSMILSGPLNFSTLIADEGPRSTAAKIESDDPSSKVAIESAIRTGDWLVVDTLNFRIRSRLSTNESVQFARRCKMVRDELQAKWFPEGPSRSWAPKAEVVIHRNSDEFHTALGHNSLGASGGVTIKQEKGSLIRRIDLRADISGWNTSSLSHELTHLVIADRFGGRQLPRWADEGMAILAETPEKQSDRQRAAVVARRIPLSQILYAQSYPDESQRISFYAQSAALTGYLVSRKGNEKFLTFIERAMDHGYDRALKETYEIEGICGLDREWNAQLNPVNTAKVAHASR